jgi:hypothetical protein
MQYYIGMPTHATKRKIRTTARELHKATTLAIPFALSLEHLDFLLLQIKGGGGKRLSPLVTGLAHVC